MKVVLEFIKNLDRPVIIHYLNKFKVSELMELVKMLDIPMGKGNRKAIIIETIANRICIPRLAKDMANRKE